MAAALLGSTAIASSLIANQQSGARSNEASSSFTGQKVCAVPKLNATVSVPLRGVLCALSALRVTPVKVCQTHSNEQRNVVVRASAAEDSEPEVVVQPAAVNGEVNPIAALKLQSELLKKKAKKLELRRKRLVRKRHLRKKGRWPPSKMKKNKNV